MYHELSIIVVNQSTNEDMGVAITPYADMQHVELIYVTPANTQQIREIEMGRDIWKIEYPETMPLDAGQVLGAHKATREKLIFAASGHGLYPHEISDICLAIDGGNSVVLRLHHPDFSRSTKNTVDLSAYVLNRVLNKPDFAASSTLRFPYGMKKNVFDGIAYSELLNPLRFLALCVLHGLQIGTIGISSPDGFIEPNRQRLSSINGDCLDAIAALFQTKGPRGGFSDLHRKRSAWAQCRPQLIKNPDYTLANIGNRDSKRRSLSIIIPAVDEESTIGRVLTEAKLLEPEEIIVVVNGSTDRTKEIASENGCTILEFPEKLGHDVGRSVGAAAAQGDVLLFLDADIAVPAEDLLPFVQVIEQGYDVAVNNIDPFITANSWDPVSAQKTWLNLCLNREYLGTASLTAVPHAIHRRVFQYISEEDLCVPPMAYAKLILSGVKVFAGKCVNVVSTNRVNDLNQFTNGRNFVEELIVGDNLEALKLVQTLLGTRSFFPNAVAKVNLEHLTK